MKLNLTQRLSVVFAVLLLVCCGTSAWLQVRSSQMHELEVVQGCLGIWHNTSPTTRC